MKLKICGLRRKEDAALVNPYPEIGYIGLVFAKSRRQVDIATALEIKGALREDIQTVAVFADNSLSLIQEVIDRVKPDIVQLHSDEDNDLIRTLNHRVWKSLAIKDSSSIWSVALYPDAEGMVLDTYSPTERGGTGEAFDRGLLHGLKYSGTLILAGGINKDNIGEVMGIKPKPDIIDISSAVETEGYKDGIKIKELIEAFRKAEEK